MKQLYIFILCGLLYAATGANAQTWSCGASLTATLSGGTLTISGTGDMTNYSSGTAPWYSVRTSITALSIGSGVITIGNSAFDGCINLTSVTIPNNVTSIGINIFGNCSGITELTLPFVGKSATATGSEAVLGYLFGEITPTFFDGFEGAINWTFVNGSQPNQWTVGTATASGGTRSCYIGSNATYRTDIFSTTYFYRDFNIVSTSENPAILSFDYKYTPYTGNEFSVQAVETSVIPQAGTSPIYPKSNLPSASVWTRYSRTLPVKTGNIRIIFHWSNQWHPALMLNTLPTPAVDNITITNGAEEWKEWQELTQGNIKQCHIPKSLKKITITSSVSSIGYGAFHKCNMLKEIDLPPSVTTIGDYAFADCSGLDSFIIPDNVSAIGNYSFLSCSGITSVAIPESVTSIGNCAFQNCSKLTAVNFNAINCATMGSSASPVFSGCTTTTTLTIGDKVTRIPDYAFSGYSSITGSLSLPASVKTIGVSSFYGCNNITGSLVIPNILTTIGATAFYGCNNITGALTIPAAVTNIGNSAFQNCSKITEIIFNATACTTMGSSASPVFSGCSGVKTLTISEGVTRIPAYCAFYGCNGITEINYNAANCPMPSDVTATNTLFNPCVATLATLHIGDKVTQIPAYTFYNCSKITNTLTLPNTLTYIGNFAFYGCNSITGTLSIPGIVTGIGVSAFQNCSGLISLTIPETVTSIGASAFQNCSKLTSVGFNAINCATMGSSALPVFSGCTATATLTLGDKVTQIPDFAFSGFSGISGTLSFPASVKTIGASSFYGCSSITGTLTISGTVTGIGASAFQNCSGIASATIPASVTIINASVFSGCSALASASLPNTLTAIGASAFSGSGLTSLTIPETVTSIGNSAFQNCSKLAAVNFNAINCTTIGSAATPVFSGCTATASLTVGDKVTQIPDYAFSGFSGIAGTLTLSVSVKTIGVSAFPGNGLTSLTIPESVTSIGNSAFQNCSKLASVNFNAINCTAMGSSAAPVFSGCTATATLTLSGQITTIPNYAFMSWSGLTSAPIPNSVKNIGISAFSGSGLTSVVIPETVTSIGNSAFSNCTKLIKVDFNATNCATAGSSTAPVFSGCTSLTNLLIGDHVTRIPDDVFRNCTKVTAAIIPASVQTVGNRSFSNCSGLTSVNIGSSVNTIGDQAFIGCSKLEALSLPSALNIIGSEAFRDCGGIVGTLTIPNAATIIGNSAFNGCKGLTALVIPSTVSAIGDGAFYDCVKLEKVTNYRPMPQRINEDVFENVFYAACELHVLSASIPNYKAADGWKNFVSIIGMNADNVTGVTVLPYSALLGKGGQQQFTADVSTTGNASKAVTWKVSGNTSAATVITGTGLLTVGADENSNSLIVTATSVFDTTKSGDASVEVKINSIATGTEEYFANDLKIYPNPFTNTVRITDVAVETWRAASLHVTNVAGVIVHTQTITHPDETIHLEHLPAGVYFFHFEKDGKTKTVKTIKIQ